MLLGRASSSGSNSSNNKDVESASFISEQEFNELYPNGFKTAISFQKPMEYWTMSLGKFSFSTIARYAVFLVV